MTLDMKWWIASKIPFRLFVSLLLVAYNEYKRNQFEKGKNAIAFTLIQKHRVSLGHS
jgi:hypothetical protein